jgi:hypothetical protein
VNCVRCGAPQATTAGYIQHLDAEHLGRHSTGLARVEGRSWHSRPDSKFEEHDD